MTNLNKDNKLIDVKPDSYESGLCHTCPHFTNKLCDTNRVGGQVLACRSQARAVVVGRYPSGRVRQSPLRVHNANTKHESWEDLRFRLKAIGESCGCVWIGFLPRTKQPTVRRWVKKGKIESVFFDGVNVRNHPALFLKIEELNENFKEWKV